MTPKDPFLEGTFWDTFWRPIRSRALLFTPKKPMSPGFSEIVSDFQQLKKGGLWEGVVQEPLRRALFCVFLCSEAIFSCKSHKNVFQKLPLQCRHFLENPLAKKTPKRSC